MCMCVCVCKDNDGLGDRRYHSTRRTTNNKLSVWNQQADGVFSQFHGLYQIVFLKEQYEQNSLAINPGTAPSICYSNNWQHAENPNFKFEIKLCEIRSGIK